MVSQWILSRAVREPKQEPETGRFVEVFKNLVFALKTLPAGC